MIPNKELYGFDLIGLGWNVPMKLKMGEAERSWAKLSEAVLNWARLGKAKIL